MKKNPVASAAYACRACGRSLRDLSLLSEYPPCDYCDRRDRLALVVLQPAFAQVGTAMPSLGITSSLGTDPSAPVGPMVWRWAYHPVSPVPNGVTGTIPVPSTSSGAGACSTLATSPMGTFGSPATYDGGGMAMANGTTTPATAGRWAA